MKYILISLLSLLVHSSYAQMAYNSDVYKKVIHDFYGHILNKKFTSLKDYHDLFGKHAEDEIFLFFKKCNDGKETDNCSQKARERMVSWSSHESLLFEELKKNRHLITLQEDDKIGLVLDKMKIVDNSIPSAIDIELKFLSGSKIVFVVNNVNGERPYILDIFLPDGLSIFYKIGIRSEANLYKRLAKIDDADGYSNVREGKGTNYMIKLKLDQKDIFFVYPNYTETWWMIEKLDCEKGYVNKNRIKLIGNLLEKERVAVIDTAARIYSRVPICN